MQPKTTVNPKAPFVVKADPVLQPLIPDYLKNRRRDLTRLADGLARSDFPLLRKLGHDMHGSGAAYGLPPISEYGRLIEEAADAQDVERARLAVEDLREFLDTVKLPP